MALLQLKKVLLRSSTYNLGVLHSWRWVLGPPWPPESSHVISVLTVDLDFFHQEIYRCVLSLFPFAVSSGSPCQSLTYRSSVFRLMRPTGAPSFWRVHSRHVILCVHIYPGGRAADLSRRTTTALIYFQSHYYLWLFVSNNAFIQISSRVIMGQLKNSSGTRLSMWTVSWPGLITFIAVFGDKGTLTGWVNLCGGVTKGFCLHNVDNTRGGNACWFSFHLSRHPAGFYQTPSSENDYIWVII